MDVTGEELSFMFYGDYRYSRHVATGSSHQHSIRKAFDLFHSGYVQVHCGESGQLSPQDWRILTAGYSIARFFEHRLIGLQNILAKMIVMLGGRYCYHGQERFRCSDKFRPNKKDA